MANSAWQDFLERLRALLPRERRLFSMKARLRRSTIEDGIGRIQRRLEETGVERVTDLPAEEQAALVEELRHLLHPPEGNGRR
jgi:hypothetical protein